jgi:cytidine deaminase
METLEASEASILYEEAREAAAFAYAPFSGFSVGAAVLTKGNRIFTGVNVENASYGLTICAERIAIGNTLSAGCHDIRAIAIHAQHAAAPPCGACRQFILEFGSEILVLFMHQGKLIQIRADELLPFAFTKEVLSK